MRLTLSVYVAIEREEGRSVYICRPLRGPQVVTKDPLLSSALSKLGNKLRTQLNEWIEAGQGSRGNLWLYDAEVHSRTVKLTLTLRDRTLRWKLLLAAFPAFDRLCVFSPSIPDVAFEAESLDDLESRAIEVYSAWATQHIAKGRSSLIADVSVAGDAWIEPLDVNVETKVRARKQPKDILAALFGGGKLSGSEELHKVGSCLDDYADSYEPALGRVELVEEVDRLLARDDRQCVLLVGPPAVGKTAIIQECAKRRSERQKQRRGQRSQMWWLSPQRLISGMSYLGQWEQRWLAILREAARRDHVLYFDDLVGLFTAGRTRDSSLSAADVLRGFLAEHPVRILAESTSEQLAILRRHDRALADRFHIVQVPSLSADDALPIIIEAALKIESQAGRYFHPQTIPLVTRQQEIFAPDRAFPGKAIEMFKTLAKHSYHTIHRGEVYRLAGTQSGASLELLLNRLGSQASIQSMLQRQLIGQPRAVEALSRVVVRYAQHLQPPDRPLGVLLLLGPTGVGKTESAKALTRMLYNDDSHLIRIDMNELTTAVAAEELVGTFDMPDGRLTSAVRRQPNCVILLDEIEKAHPDVFDYLLQVLGEGRLTDARGRVADFRSAIIILTSNLGAAEQTSSLGFDVSAERRSQIYVKAAQNFFRPEFFNRIDEVVAFRSLDTSDMEQIVRIQLEQVLARDGIKRRGAFVKVNESAVQRVIKSGFDSQLGARAVRRMLEREVIGPLGNCLSSLPVSKPTLIHVTHPANAVQLDCRAIELDTATYEPVKLLDNLPSVIEATEGLYARLDSRLNEISQELKDLDASSEQPSHNASYYALREQLYRCAELRKAAQFHITQRPTPRLDLPPPTQAKPTQAKPRSRGPSRNALRDWATQGDLVADFGSTSLEASPITTEELLLELIRSFTVAHVMVSSALSPRNWLVGFESLTGDELLLGRQLDRETMRFGFDMGMHSHDEPMGFLVQLISCLHEYWQYELGAAFIKGGFMPVSGVSLIGILGPLLGTYQYQSLSKANQLLVLRAIPFDLSLSIDERESLVAKEELLSTSGTLLTPQEQVLPTQVVHTTLAAETVNLRRGATLHPQQEDWFDHERQIQRFAQWWIKCLPVPKELQQS
jgi:ATP-dependent Clp protease ATP-binding subunit ClpC